MYALLILEAIVHVIVKKYLYYLFVQLSDICWFYSSYFAFPGLQGVQPLLDAVLSYLPCPTEVSNFALDQTKNEEKVFDLWK